jgi:hypothetical protein
MIFVFFGRKKIGTKNNSSFCLQTFVMRILISTFLILWMQLHMIVGSNISLQLDNSVRIHTYEVPSTSKKSLTSVSLATVSSSLYLERLAGSSTTGNSGDNGPATLAKIKAKIPWVDGLGNVYIPDYSYHRIRKVDLAGIITTFGGTGSASSAGTSGPIGSVSFYNPYSIVGDTAGTAFYISDQKYIWKYLISTNIVSAFAQSISLSTGFSGDNGPATSAQLWSPRGLWLSTSGSLFIADTNNHRIRNVDSFNSFITTVAGSGGTGSFSGDNGPATSANLNYPQGVYMDTVGKSFIADSENHRIRVVATNNIITTFAGTGIATPFNGDNLPRLSANLNTPYDVKGDSAGNIYIADYGNCIVRVVDDSGVISVFFGTPNVVV